MAEQKKVLISVPKSWLSNVDDFARISQLSRSELIRVAVTKYILAEQLRLGYTQMAEINTQFAEDDISGEIDNLMQYEGFLANGLP